MKKIIERYRRVSKRQILDCRIKSISEMIKQSGLDFNSYETMLICRSCSFHYGRIDILNVVNNLPYAVASKNDIEEIIFSELELSYQKIIMHDNKEEWNILKKMIDHDIPVLFKVDCRFLNQAGIMPDNVKINIHYLSSLLLVGYDEEIEKVFIVLTNSDEQEYLQALDFSDFQKYRYSDCIPYSPKGICYCIPYEAKQYRINSTEKKNIIMRALHKTAEEMILNEKSRIVELNHSVCRKYSSGINALKELRKDLVQIGVSCIYSKKKNSFARLSFLFLRNNLMFGSYSAFREEFGKSLSFFANEYNLEELKKLGIGFVDLSFKWKKLLARMGQIGRKKYVRFSGLSAIIILSQIIITEKRLFTYLEYETGCNVSMRGE